MATDKSVDGSDAFCRHCGHRLGQGDEFCGGCGSPVDTAPRGGPDPHRDDPPAPVAAASVVPPPPSAPPGSAAPPPPPPAAAAASAPADAPRQGTGPWAAFRGWPVGAQVAVWVVLALLLLGMLALLVAVLGGDDGAEPAADAPATTAPAARDLSGTWEATLLIMQSVNSVDAEETVLDVVISCTEDGTCATLSEDAVFEPLGGDRYTISGDFLGDCVDPESAETAVTLGYDMRRDGEAEITVGEGGRITEVQAVWTDVGTPNEAGIAGGCPRAEEDYETTLVRSQAVIDVPDPEPAEAIAGFGSDATLDGLAEQCEAGDLRACDGLYLESDSESGYQRYGDGCGGRNTPSDYCIKIYSWVLRAER